MNVAICDDNKQVAEHIKKIVLIYFAQTNYQYEVETFYSGEDLLNANMNWDIAFLDVEMNGISGIGVSKELRERNPQVKIILVTAYNHYMDDALDLKLCRFINKPVEKSRVISCLSEAITQFANDNSKEEFKYNNGSVFLSANDIVYFCTEDKNAYVFTYDKRIKSHLSFSQLMEKYKNKGFVQTHKSFSVNCRYVDEITPTSVKLTHKGKSFEVHISRRFAKSCKKSIETFLHCFSNEV